MRKPFSVGHYGDAARGMAIKECQRQLDLLAGRLARHPGDQVPGAGRPVRQVVLACVNTQFVHTRAWDYGGTVGGRPQTLRDNL